MGDVNIWAVAVAALAGFLLGGLWYSPVLFVRPWIAASGRQPQMAPAVFGVYLLFALLAASAFALWLGPRPALNTAILHGLSVGVCFAAGSLGINYAAANRGLTLWLIDGGFHVARFVVFGLVLALWP